jgi:hypothetical protein
VTALAARRNVLMLSAGFNPFSSSLQSALPLAGFHCLFKALSADLPSVARGGRCCVAIAALYLGRRSM